MKTLIVPCAGRSSRFPGMPPKWMLLYPDGKMMIQKALDGLQWKEFDLIIFTIVREHVRKYQADRILQNIFQAAMSEKFRLCILDDFTSCQAETVWLTLEKNQIKGGFVVKDSDNYIKADTPGETDFVAGIHINTFPREIQRLAAKSFLRVNSQKVITDIIEKKIVSEYISVGMYGFRDADLFKKAYLHLRDVSDKSYEIYLSHIISYLIGTKKSVYRYLEAEDYEDWGTRKDWNIVLDEKRTILVNIDGLLFEKRNRYIENGPDRHLVPKQENMERIRQEGIKGAQIILLTSMPEEYRKQIQEQMEGFGIPVHQIVTGCYLSHKLLIDTSDKSIPYPGCAAVNISDNAGLGEYL